MNVYLIGYMGSGKTTAGRLLARKLGLQHLDMDDLFEYSYKISVSDFFAKYNEEAFRIIETDLLRKTFELSNCIISTGGGTPCFNNNIALINNHGLSVYIRMSPKSLFERLKQAKRPRPLIQNLSEQLLFDKITQDLEIREPFYNQAQVIIKGENIDLEELAKIVRPIIGLSF